MPTRCSAFWRCPVESKKGQNPAMKYWELVADNLSKAGWSWGYVSAIDSNGRTIWIADAHRDDGKRFVVRSDEKLTAFVELESAIRAVERLEPRNRQSTTHKAVRTFALARFAFSIQVVRSDVSFRLVRRIENCSGEMQACLWHHFSL
jgi:hypothetical protein